MRSILALCGLLALSGCASVPNLTPEQLTALGEHLDGCTRHYEVMATWPPFAKLEIDCPAKVSPAP